MSESHRTALQGCFSWHGAEPTMFPSSQSRIPQHGPLLSPRSHPSDPPLFPGNLHLLPEAASSGVQQGRELMECVSVGCRLNKLPFAISGCCSR